MRKIEQRVENEYKARAEKLAARKRRFWREEEMVGEAVEVLSGNRLRRDLDHWSEQLLGQERGNLREMGMAMRKRGRIAESGEGPFCALKFSLLSSTLTSTSIQIWRESKVEGEGHKQQFIQLIALP